MTDLLQRRRMADCLSDFTLDLLIADALEPEERCRTVEHLGSCLTCLRRQKELEQTNEELIARRPRLLAVGEGMRRRSALSVGRGAVIGAVALAAFALGHGLSSRGERDEPGIRSKGTGRITFYVKHGDSMREGAAGEIVHAGDILQLSYAADEPSYLAVLSRDGAGKVSVYFPRSKSAARITPGHDILLPQSIVLDDALGPEHIFALFCTAPVSLDQLASALAKGTRLPVFPKACTVERFVVYKRANP